MATFAAAFSIFRSPPHPNVAIPKNEFDSLHAADSASSVGNMSSPLMLLIVGTVLGAFVLR
jgi:hypothetical protein